MTFPVHRHVERTLPRSWGGEVLVCDVDRTYLATRFSSLRGLFRIPFEFAVDKQDIAGMAALLRELRRGPGPASRCTPLYFISASPAQLMPVLQRKMLLDGVEWDGMTFKDWKGVLRSLRPARFREQLGFKLTALLLGRTELPVARELLIGDDLESDPLAFALYADLLAGRLQPGEVVRILVRHGVARDDASAAVALAPAPGPPGAGGVSRAYIRMERSVSPDTFLDCWPGLVACRGAFQMALSLWAGGQIGSAGVIRVAWDLRTRGVSGDVLGLELGEASRRCLLDAEHTAEIHGLLAGRGLLARWVPALARPDPLWQEAAVHNADKPWTPPRYRLGG